MQVRVLSKRAILCNFKAYLPLLLVVAFLYFVFGAGGLFFLLKNWISDDDARIVAILGAALGVITGTIWYVRFVVNRLSRSHLSLDDNTVTIRGQTIERICRKRIPRQ